MPLPFSSLRGNLIAAFVAVIALSLLLASAAFAYLLRDFQAGRERDRLENIAMYYTIQVNRLSSRGLTLPAISNQLDESTDDSGARVLLLDDHSTVLHDTANDRFTGVTVEIPTTPGRRPNVVQGTLRTPSGESLYAVVGFADPHGYRLAVVAPVQSLTNAWGEVLPRLSIAAAAALLVSIAIAWWVASAITRPIAQITRASEEMARGNLDPHLTLPDTSDEVGRLSKAFTTMAREVARSHRAMRDLLANVSHDLRTPLTSVSGFAGALVDGTLSGPDGAREAGRIIGEEAERMRRLVEDLLYLGRIESGDVALQREQVDLAELARAVQARFAFRAQESRQRFTVQAVEPVRVRGDARRLGQVLDNLVENAFKHTPAGGSIDVTVTLEPLRANGRTVRGAHTAVLSVRNSGSYIPPEEAERVFERFYQIDKARPASDGRGLGLAIAREIVQAHGGQIDLHSSPNAGTAFSVRLPALEPATIPPLPSTTEPARPAEVGAVRR
jgi:signal transduction histidine kinase